MASGQLCYDNALKEKYIWTVPNSLRKLNKGGVVFADEMCEYLEYVRDSGKYDSRFIDTGFDGIEISMKQF